MAKLSYYLESGKNTAKLGFTEAMEVISELQAHEEANQC